MESTRQLISQVYSTVFGSTSFSSFDEQLRSIDTSIRSVIQLVHGTTLQDVSVSFSVIC